MPARRAPFGVCLIREGREVGAARGARDASAASRRSRTGTCRSSASSISSRAAASASGCARPASARTASSRLRSSASPADPAGGEVDPACGEVLKRIIEHVGASALPRAAHARRRGLGRLPPRGGPAARHRGEAGAARAAGRGRTARAPAAGAIERGLSSRSDHFFSSSPKYPGNSAA